MMSQDSPAETDQNTPASPPVESSAGEAAETNPATGSDPDAQPGEADDLDPYTALENERDRWKDLALRVQADFDNFRKRTAREVTEIRRFAASALLEDLLPVLDNFDLGLMAARQEGENSPISMGMAMVRRQLDDFLTSQGVKEIPTDGERFDPTRHDAVATEADAAIPEGTILRVARKGYFLHDRVLRAPSVVVSSGPIAESPEPESAN
jgi:molecular chaperone GrpE